jgi:hypothetical protein
MVSAYIHWANHLESLGMGDQAGTIVAELAGLPLSDEVRRRVPAELSWFRGKAALGRHRWLSGLGWLARACLQRPSFIRNLISAVPRRVGTADRWGP